MTKHHYSASIRRNVLPPPRYVLASAGVTKPPILDWFHIAMRWQHAKVVVTNLSNDDPYRG